MATKIHKFVYIGRSFYNASGTAMGCIYEIKNKKFYRSDWGSVENLLDENKKVNIRFATKGELIYFYDMLENKTY